MIKKLTFILLAASCMQSMYSQNTEKNEKFLENKTLFELALIPVPATAKPIK